MTVNKHKRNVIDGRMLAVIPIAGIFFKFLLFNLIWCSYTTFTPFSCWESYISALVATLALSVIYILTRRVTAAVVVMAMLDVWMVANLMYYRTYFSAIPPSSYLLAGNLADFLPSVTASLRWCDLLFPVSTAITAILTLRTNRRQKATLRLSRQAYLDTFILLCALLSVNLTVSGGFIATYRALQTSAHLLASGPAIYTLFGSLYFDYAEELPDLTKEQEQEINTWLCERPPLLPIQGLEPRDNCILILTESLESWVLNLTVEGQEITPCLNKLLKEPTTLYAPRVLTQVNGGRSIDAQLLALAGLLPVQAGAFSSRFPLNRYHTLPQAMKELKGSRNYLLTVDKTKTWNQGVVAQSFGIDTIISYPDFRMTETFGNRRRLGDRAFFAQCREKMENGEIWHPGENVFIQMVTYSGHSPFKMPESLKSVHFSNQIPELMADYMSVAHYTDEAIGILVEYLKTRPEYQRTIVVITGDHEGLAGNRKGLCGSAAGKGIVSDKEFTPFIVLNSPAPMRYTEVMGQIDIYPTLLNLLGLEKFRWSGIGQSILDPRKPGIAISPRRKIEGDTSRVSKDELSRIRRSPVISDRIIRFDKLKDL